MQQTHLTHVFFKTVVLHFMVLTSFSIHAQIKGTTYDDGHGKKVYLPFGYLSFADEVVSFTKGEPPAILQSSKPYDALSAPDYDGIGKGFLSLGCGGVLILKFTNNALVNIVGPDLYIFEVGKYIESTELSISKDGINWISIGTINGAKAEVDIEKFTKPNDVFNFIRLIDLKTECKGKWSGADIDAVASIGSAKRISFSNTILFSLNESVLKPQAKKVLDDLIKEINQTSIENIVVEGYTDNSGTNNINKNLSLERAIAVKAYLKKYILNKKIKITAYGLGETNPLFPNDNQENQEKNRRVEVILFPSK